MAYPYRAVATLKYKPPPGSSDSVAFAKGEKLVVLASADDDGDWLRGTNEAGHEGIFPAQFVEQVEEPVEVNEPPEQVKEEEEPVASGVVEPVVKTEGAPPPEEASPAPVVEEPVVPIPVRQPSLPPLAAAEPTPPPPTVTTPPVPAPKKLSALQARIAALNAAGAGAAPPPQPRPKPVFRPKNIPAPAAPHLPPTSPPSHTSSLESSTSISTPPTASSHTSIERTDLERAGEKGAMSAEDAKESIGKGGSLKDRIAALQGGLQSFEPPPPPGRAPKPWKRKTIPVEEEAPADVGEGEAKSPAASIASLPPVVASPSVEKADPSAAVGALQSDVPASSGFESPLTKAKSLPVADDASASSSPAPDETLEEHEPTEEEKRSAIASRMAGLGGQRVGMAIPALPRKAGPPRRRPVATPTPVSPPAPTEEPEVIPAPVQEKNVESAPEVAPLSHETAEPEVAKAAKVQEEEFKDFDEELTASGAAKVGVAAVATTGLAVGGAAALLGGGDEKEAEKEVEEKDEFDTPSLPEEPARSLPPPTVMPRRRAPPVVQATPVEPEPEQEDEDEPEEKTHEVDEYEPLEAEADVPSHDEPESVPVQHEPIGEPRHSQDTEDSLDEPESPVSSPPFPPGRPPIPHSFESRDLLSLKIATAPTPAVEPENEDERAPRSPTSPSSPSRGVRPALPAIPASFAIPAPHPTREAIVIPRATEAVDEDEEQEEEDEGVDDSRRVHLVEKEEVEEKRPSFEQQGSPVRPPPRKLTVPPPPVAEPAGDEGDKEEEEEDPEVTRRRAIRDRMAKLGGMNPMRMGMGMPPPVAPRKVKKASTSDAPPEEPAAEEAAPTPPPRRIPGIPTGGMLLPGIVPRSPPAPAPVEPEEEEPAAEPEPAEEETEEEEEEEEEVAPPPLPKGRPSSQLPPRRSVPTPQEEAPALPVSRPPQRFVAEPTDYNDDEEREQEQVQEEEEEPRYTAPPPLPPSSPPSRRAPLPTHSTPSSPVKQPSLSLFKSRTSLDYSNGGILGVTIPRGSIDLERPTTHESPVFAEARLAPQASRSSVSGGNFKARDLDLELGAQWWRATPFSPPMSIKARKDVAFDVSESTATKRGRTHHNNEIEVIYDDFSRTLISISFADDDLSESTTTTSQTHSPPPPFPSASTLSTFSSTVGTQIFAAAHSKSSDKSRTTQEAFLAFCFSRASDPLPPIGHSYGIQVLSLYLAPTKGATLQQTEVDEPRAGDVVVFWDVKFKHGLTSTKVGAADVPHVGVVGAWDAKKRKIRALEVGKDGAVEEGAWRVEDLKSGAVVVYRVVDRAWLDSRV